MSKDSSIQKSIWMRISIWNYEYDSIILIFLNTHCWSMVGVLQFYRNLRITLVILISSDIFVLRFLRDYTNTASGERHLSVDFINEPQPFTLSMTTIDSTHIDTYYIKKKYVSWDLSFVIDHYNHLVRLITQFLSPLMLCVTFYSLETGPTV